MTRQTEKTVIKIETFQRTVFRSRRKAKVSRCDQCAVETLMLPPNEAAALWQTTEREIFRRVEAGETFWGNGIRRGTICEKAIHDSSLPQ